MMVRETEASGGRVGGASFAYVKSGNMVAQARSAGRRDLVLQRSGSGWLLTEMVIDFDPIGMRLQAGFISQSLNLTGLLYWRIDRWGSDPWNNVNNQGVFNSSNYPGEGVLVYRAALPASPEPCHRYG